MSGFLDLLEGDSFVFPDEELPDLDFDLLSASLDPYPNDPFTIEPETIDDSSDNDDGLASVPSVANDEVGYEEEGVLSWKIEHASGDHKLKARDFITKVESTSFDGAQALEMLHRRHTMDYGSRRSGSKCADIGDEYHPLFFLDYLSIIGRPLRPLTRLNDRFFDNVTVSFKNWQKPYSAKHQSKLTFSLQNRTFHIASAATREDWFIVMHPIVAPAVELLSRTERLKRQAKSSQESALTVHHAEALTTYIKEIFQSGGLVGERVESSWMLNSSLAQQLTFNKWTRFQEQFMEDWPRHVGRYAYDTFWGQNQPVFHAYDYGANIPIEVNTRVESLERETRLRPDNDEESESGSSSGEDEEESHPLRHEPGEFDWPLNPGIDHTDHLYSDGLRTLMTELDQKYDLQNIGSISYAIAVDLHCLDGQSEDGEDKTAFCMLADRNMVRREYTLANGLTFYPMALHPAYGNFTSAGPPNFLEDHVLTVMRDNMSFQNDGADVLSCEYFQGYSNIKRSIRYNPEDLLVTQGTATAALTLPVADANSSHRTRTKQQTLLNRLQGGGSPHDPNASKPFARERLRIQQALDENEFAFRMEQVMSINVANLVPSQLSFRTVLRPIFQLMRFYLQEPEHYIHILRCFRPSIFPRILGSFARMFEVAIDEMLVRFRAQQSTGLGVALSEGVAALDRLGNHCFTGSPQVLMSSVMKPLRTIDSLRRGGWPFIDPHMLDLRHGEGSIDLASWPRSGNKRPILMHVASLGFHYGPEVAASRQNVVWFRDVGGQSILGPAGASRFLEDLFRDLWIPQMVAFVRHQLRRDGHLSNSPELPEKLAMLEEWSRSAHPFSWTAYTPIWSLSKPCPESAFQSTKSRQDLAEEVYSACLLNDTSRKRALASLHSTWFVVLHTVLSCTDLGTVSRKHWVEALSAGLTANHVECMPGSFKARLAYRHVVKLIGFSLPARAVSARPGSLKRAAIEAEYRAGQAPRRQRINLGSEIPFTCIPPIVANGFKAQEKIFANGNQKILEHYHVSRNCLERNLGDPLCDLLLILVLTLSASSVTPTVAPQSRSFEEGSRKDPGVFAASLVTRMLWFLYPRAFPWDEDDGVVLRVSEMTKKLEHKGVSNRVLRELGWVVTESQRDTPRNSELRLRPEGQLVQLRTDLLSLRRDPAGFIARVFNTHNSVWMERCCSIIEDRTKRPRTDSASLRGV